jgi:probable phosphoglycerate mutase
MSGATTLILARHGQTDWHAENRYAGVSDIDLTDKGRSQTWRLAAWAIDAGLDAVASSPVRCAVETAELSAQATGLPLEIVDDLREIDFGSAEGCTMEELAAVDPRMMAHFRADPVTHHFPGGEPPADAAHRATRALREVADEHAGQRVLVVAHDSLIRLALCRLLDIDLRRYRRAFHRLDHAALTHVSLAEAGDASLSTFNVPVPHSPTDESTWRNA